METFARREYKEHKGAIDVFALVDLNGDLYLGDVFTTYEHARRAGETWGRPSEIKRYSLPLLAETGKYCPDCHNLIVRGGSHFTRRAHHAPEADA